MFRAAGATANTGHADGAITTGLYVRDIKINTIGIIGASTLACTNKADITTARIKCSTVT